jgi:hypothetical protein
MTPFVDQTGAKRLDILSLKTHLCLLLLSSAAVARDQVLHAHSKFFLP